MDLRSSRTISADKATGILIGIALNLQFALGSIAILAIISLPIHEHGVSLHLFTSSLISLNNALSFLLYNSFTSLVKSIPMVFLFVCLFWMLL